MHRELQYVTEGDLVSLESLLVWSHIYSTWTDWGGGPLDPKVLVQIQLDCGSICF